jgi:DNA-binding transcriptional LysR family regulator
MDLTELQIFKTVVEQGGISKAAAKLHRVPSNVTTRVKQLEARLGTRLFMRNGRKLTLSAEGKLLLGYAERLLLLSTEAEIAIRNGKPRGTLRLGTLESTAATRLPRVLSRYHLTYPDVDLEIVTGTTGALINRVMAQDIEAAFVAEPFNKNDLETQPAFTEELVLITPKSFQKVRAPKDIGKRTVIAFATGCSYRRRLEAWFSAAKVVPDRVMEMGSYHAIVACVSAGAGIAVVPRAILAITTAEKEIAVHTLPNEVSRAKTHLIWRRGHQSAALTALRTQLVPNPSSVKNRLDA